MTHAAVQVAENIYQVQIPLPFALRIVNCYLLRDDEGWTMLDTGLNRAETHAVWQAAFTELGVGPGDLRQIVLTHFHPDHYGAAGWFQAWSGGETPVYISPRDAEQARLVWQLPEGQPEPMHALFLAFGTPFDLADSMAFEVARLRRMTAPHPQFTSLMPGSTLRMGGRDFQAIYAPGHSDGQVIFYDPSDQLILSGDQVLIKITPNIGIWPESEPDPLGRFLASLHALAALEVRVGLPGHGPLIRDWCGRLAELSHHHEERLQHTLESIGTEGTVYDAAQQVFPFARLTYHEMRFAVAETAAHLDLLVSRGALRKETAEVWRYWRV